MAVLIVALLGVFYIGIAVLVARLCSINSRWEEIADRIPAPRIVHPGVRAPLLRDDVDLLDESEPAARHAPGGHTRLASSAHGE